MTETVRIGDRLIGPSPSLAVDAQVWPRNDKTDCGIALTQRHAFSGDCDITAYLQMKTQRQTPPTA